jgi:hypothetical protein
VALALRVFGAKNTLPPVDLTVAMAAEGAM